MKTPEMGARLRLQEALETAIQKGRLSEKDQIILQGRLGLDGPWQTLSAVGRHLGLTRERVRQRQNVSLHLLCQQPDCFEALCAYLLLVPPPGQCHRCPGWLTELQSVRSRETLCSHK